MKKFALFKFFSSLKLAVFSILLLAAVLAWATIIESYYGMRGVHAMVYGTPWFLGVLGLLGLNVLCAALSRYPWKKHQTGFVVTHLGILTILAGSYLTQKWGVDGNLPITEKSQARDVYLTEMVLNFYDEAGIQRAEINFPESAVKREGNLLTVKLPDGQSLVVEEYLPRLQYEKSFVASPLKGMGVPAMQVELYNSRFNVLEWLNQKHPEKPGQLNLGPAVVELSTVWNEKELKDFLDAKPPKKEIKSRTGYIVARHQGRDYRISIDEGLVKYISLGSSGFEVKIEKYLPFAVVEGNKLVTRSNEPNNPAVQLLLRDKNGAVEKHSLFALYPEFNTRHVSHDRSLPAFGVDLRMVSLAMEEQMNNSVQGMGRLEFAVYPAKNELYYRSFGRAGDFKLKGQAKPGEELLTGWMDLKFKVLDFFPYAVESEEPKYVEYIAGQDGGYLSGFRFKREGRDTAGEPLRRWVFEGQTESIPVGNETWVMQFTKRRLQLPFQIALEKFMIGTDPGTTKAATYSSDVVVKDGVHGVTLPSHISMNEPLKYGGYTFYQASYQMEEGKPPVSILAVNVDPGRWIKYLGSIVMVLGIALMFYMNPHYWGIVFGSRKHAKD